MLGRGELFGIYPEGTRSHDGRLYKGRTGVARLALLAGVPVIPSAVIGTDVIAPPGKIVKRIISPTVRFGPPLDFSRYAGMSEDRFILRSITDEIMYAIMELSGQEYVDHVRPRGQGGRRPRGQGRRGRRGLSAGLSGASLRSLWSKTPPMATSRPRSGPSRATTPLRWSFSPGPPAASARMPGRRPPQPLDFPSAEVQMTGGDQLARRRPWNALAVALLGLYVAGLVLFCYAALTTTPTRTDAAITRPPFSAYGDPRAWWPVALQMLLGAGAFAAYYRPRRDETRSFSSLVTAGLGLSTLVLGVGVGPASSATWPTPASRAAPTRRRGSPPGSTTRGRPSTGGGPTPTAPRPGTALARSVGSATGRAATR